MISLAIHVSMCLLGNWFDPAGQSCIDCPGKPSDTGGHSCITVLGKPSDIAGHSCITVLGIPSYIAGHSCISVLGKPSDISLAIPVLLFWVNLQIYRWPFMYYCSV